MASFNGFDASQYEDVQDRFELIPVGEYKMVMIEADWKESKSGTAYMGMQFEIVEGSYKGRRIYKNFFLRSENETARRISGEHLSMLIRACGLNNADDTDQLLNKVVIGRVSIWKNKDGNYRDQNEINFFKPLNNAKAEQPVKAYEAETDDCPF